MPSKLLIRGATVWTHDGALAEQDLLIEDGRVSRLGRGLVDGAAPKVEAKGWLVLPGLVDLHAHLGEPGRDDRESLETGLFAAAQGGFTHVVVMPDTDPPIDDEAGVEFVLAKGRRLPGARIHVCGALTKGRQGREMTELLQMAKAGAAIFGDVAPTADAALLRRALEYAKLVGLPVVTEAQDAALSAGGLVHEGEVGGWLGLAGIPAAGEWAALARDLLIAEGFGGRLHVQGISTARSVELAAWAKERGAAVTVETPFHHLILSDQDLRDYRTAKKLMPPLRPASDRDALIEGVRSGAVDCIVTDHTPLTAEEMDVEFDAAPFGAAGFETALPALYTHCIEPGKLDWDDLVRAMSLAPRAVLGLEPPAVKPGGPADFTLFNPEGETVISPKTWISRGRNTPFEGETLQGAVEGVLIGRAVYGRLGEEFRES